MVVAMASSCSKFGLYSNLRAMEKQSSSRASSFLSSFVLDPPQLSCITSKKRYFMCFEVVSLYEFLSLFPGVDI